MIITSTKEVEKGEKMPPLIDLTGKKFNHLTVIERAENIGRQTAWKCLCDCGNFTVIRGAYLKNNHTISCGCEKTRLAKEKYRKLAEQNIGQKFGHLTIISVSENRREKDSSHILYNCICDCGSDKIIEVNYKDLKNHHTTSCGCLLSKGEEKIKNILNDNNIPFIQQKTFDDCRFPDTNALAKFDFYVNNQYIIEFDGKQHFIAYDSGWSTFDLLKKTQYKDLFKNQYCFNHNIPIIRIPYTELENITICDLSITSKFLLKEAEP